MYKEQENRISSELDGGLCSIEQGDFDREQLMYYTYHLLTTLGVDSRDVVRILKEYERPDEQVTQSIKVIEGW